MTRQFILIIVAIFSFVATMPQDLQPKDVAELHFKAIVNTDGDAISRLNSYSKKQLGITENIIDSSYWSNIYQAIAEDVTKSFMQSLSSELKNDKDIAHAAQQRFTELFQIVRNTKFSISKIELRLNDLNENLADIEYTVNGTFVDYDKFLKEIEDKQKKSKKTVATKADYLKVFDDMKLLSQNLPPPVTSKLEYTLYETKKDNKTYWMNGSMFELLSNVITTIVSAQQK